MLPVHLTVWLGLIIYLVLLSHNSFAGTLRGGAIDYIVHISHDNQWILNQTSDPLEQKL